MSKCEFECNKWLDYDQLTESYKQALGKLVDLSHENKLLKAENKRLKQVLDV